MAYQVIARKWRPQRFDDVVGQQAVTRTLKNALSSGRLAQAFVFAGPRGVGKTTTARILARALNCEKGPTGDPCGVCDACVEIAEGRDIDVLEIDAATHTGVDNVREVIIAGLGIMPVRNRYKVFIIDEVHQLSTPSFNALLKSIEEPPPHVVFMMATTELDRIPDTVLSRSQVYEFRTIGTTAIVAQLRKIVDADGITVSDESLQLIARDADGSMRDAQSKLDQVIAFTGNTIGADDVTAVLGLVGRDLLLNTFQAVADEDATSAFALAGRAVEMGYDLRLVCRELSRVARDLLVLSVDPSACQRSGNCRRSGARSAAGSGEALLARRSVARVRSADEGGGGHPKRGAATVSPRDGPAAMDLSAQAGVDRGADSVGGQRRDRQGAGLAASVATSDRASRPASGTAADECTSAAGADRHAALVIAGAVTTGRSQSRRACAGREPDRCRKRRTERRVARRDPQVQAGDVQLAGRAGAAPRRGGRSHHPDVCRVAEDRADLRQVPAGARSDRDPPRRTQDHRRVRHDRQGAGRGQRHGRRKPVDADRKTALKEQALADAGVQAMLEVFPAEIRDVEEM